MPPLRRQRNNQELPVPGGNDRKPVTTFVSSQSQSCRELGGHESQTVFQCLSYSWGEKGLNMNCSTPESSNGKALLRLAEVPEAAVSSDFFWANLEAERKYLEQQAETERYWAGRNLAGRNSTRRAA